jgi:anaerobic magnesium-protoporphyrin IX monomethyl ester cyclase
MQKKRGFMKVLLFNPKVAQLSKRLKAPTLPLGLLAVASYIKTKGHQVKIVDLTVKSENLKKQIRDFNPDIVGVTVHSNLVVKSTLKVSKAAKKLNKPVVWGGFLPSVLTELCFQEGCVDFVVISEGEVTFSELLDAMENGKPHDNIDGLAFVDKNGVHINKERTFSDLAEFPSTDWTLIEPKKYVQRFFYCKRMLYLYFSKGCPARCTFCYNSGYHRSSFRKRPPEQVIEEIEYLVKNCGIDGIYFADEYLCPGKEDMDKFISLLKEKNLNITWGGQTRLGVYSKEELQRMYNAGCRSLLIGVESGSDERIKKIKKNINLKQARETFANCKEIGITTQSSFIIGYPDETEEELKQTVRFALSLDTQLSPFNVYFMQPGSEEFDSAVRNGRYKPPKNLKEWSKLQADEYDGETLSKIPRKELLVIHFYAQWRGFSKKESVNSDSYGIIKQQAIQAIKNILQLSFYNIIIGSFASAKQFFTVLWYAKAYPKILKKYGLQDKNSTDINKARCQ